MKGKSGGYGFLGKLYHWQIMNQPMGRAVVYSFGAGLAKGLASTTGMFVAKVDALKDYQVIASNVLVAILMRINKLRSLIGSNFADIIATFAWMEAIKSKLDVSGKVEGFFNDTVNTNIKKITGMSGFGYAPAAISGLGDIDTVVPVQEDFGAVDSLTSLESKLASIAG